MPQILRDTQYQLLFFTSPVQHSGFELSQGVARSSPLIKFALNQPLQTLKIRRKLLMERDAFHRFYWFPWVLLIFPWDVASDEWRPTHYHPSDSSI